MRDVVTKGGDTVFHDLEDRFQEVVVEGKRKKTSVVNYTESTSSEKKDVEGEGSETDPAKGHRREGKYGGG